MHLSAFDLEVIFSVCNIENKMHYIQINLKLFLFVNKPNLY